MGACFSQLVLHFNAMLALSISWEIFQLQPTQPLDNSNYVYVCNIVHGVLDDEFGELRAELREN